jgi:hypothetical protein
MSPILSKRFYNDLYFNLFFILHHGIFINMLWMSLNLVHLLAMTKFCNGVH